MKLKHELDIDVYSAAKERVEYTFDNFEKIFVSFSGGKDSTVMLHMVAEEAIKRNRKVGVMIVDLEAQYEHTIAHLKKMLDLYKDNIEVFWVCLPIKLRNAVSNFEPCWCCWDDDHKDNWVREIPEYEGVISDVNYFPFFQKNMEFEEFIVLFGEWYSQGVDTAAFVGIRADESLNRFRTIAVFEKETFKGKRWTTKVSDGLYNIYPIYDWRTRDIWIYQSKNNEKPHNEIYDLMYKAGLTIHQQRLCQPYGDDQKKGLWLYHILEPQTWYKVVNRVNGVNSGSLYINENGNMTGQYKITKPEGHTYKSFCNLLLSTMPDISRRHYIDIFKRHIKGWKSRGYKDGIPDEAPLVLENKHWCPSWKRLCKVLLRNDWWGKGLGMTQPKSAAYAKYLKIKNDKKSLTNSGA